MSLTSRDPDAEPRPDIEDVRKRLLVLSRELAEVQAGAEANDAAYQKARKVEERSSLGDEQRREEELDEDIEEVRERHRRKRRQIEFLREQGMGRIARACARLGKRLDEELQAERHRANAEVAAIRERIGAKFEDRRAPLTKRVRRWEELSPVLARGYEETRSALADFASRHRVALPNPGGEAGSVDAEVDPDLLAEETTSVLADVRESTEVAGARFVSTFGRPGHLLLYLCLIVAAAVGGLAVAIPLEAAPAVLIGIGAGALVLSGLVLFLAGAARRSCGRIAAELAGRAGAAIRRFELHAEAALKHLDARHVEIGEEHAAERHSAEGRAREESRVRTEPILERQADLERRRERAESRLVGRAEDQLRVLDEEIASIRQRRREEIEAETKRQGDEHEARLEALASEHETKASELRSRRDAAVGEFDRFAASLTRVVSNRHRPWGEIDADGVELPRTFPRFVPFGHIRVPLAGLAGAPEGAGESATEFVLPAALTFPEHGSLLVEHAVADRERAQAILGNAVLRALIALPAGKVRLTILDPVGLGQSFSALMHLADHDEALVNGRIWTETQHIEQRLADLTEHIEKVIQKYLRNRFVTIDDYNEEAGELQEPYHILVIADFPTAFNELAAERLASIVSSGPRCGVYTFVARDKRQTVPAPVVLDLLRRNGPTIRVEKDRYRLSGEGLEPCEFVPEPPPESSLASRMLDRIGRLSVDADHVELPFGAALPPDGALWTGSTRSRIQVPIGRTGAERLQFFDLGRGTAQHALVAGRTGSGKSTLFHVMITNLSIWFSPDEIEFYLVDFKKGVEFKPYASHALPHARVVAIESDREFGLSVLKAVDAELARRGDLFRAESVQDLAAFRRQRPDVPMPRSLLMIDEFQEFFTEDDVVAHDAALLLDRFVRQGRAFGIHVVLGSQTLSGIYTLARSTLGQMGVRIALQCNESDSYLILSEDNGVARLLARPGEAIYNDKSGLLEGNNPFQVVWLSDEEKERQLRRIAERVREEPPRRKGELVVFEGNKPADIEKNAELRAALAGEGPASVADDRAWLGDPNSIKGPTEVRFPPASGSNLLIAGQRRDAAFAMMAASILSLSAQRGPDDLRLVILDGGGHEPEYAAHFENLFRAVPHRIERYDLRTAGDAVTEIAALVKAREDEEDEDRVPLYLFAFGLQRLRMLRQGDEFAMPFGDEPSESTGDQFTTILTEGPPQSVHTVIWCDTVANLQRTVSRRALREFDMRVLFQMSAADSSELIDSSAANQLGLYNALLAVESQGTFEKFRPYAIPTDEVLLRLTGAGNSS